MAEGTLNNGIFSKYGQDDAGRQYDKWRVYDGWYVPDGTTVRSALAYIDHSWDYDNYDLV